MFDPTLAAIRFGDGLSPDQPPPTSSAEIMARLRGPDLVTKAYPVAGLAALRSELVELEDLQRAFRRGRQSDQRDTLQEAYRAALRPFNRARFGERLVMMGRALSTEDSFRERLVRFWADHFTVVGKGGLTRWLVPNYIEDAIRPHVAGRFGDMLAAAISHPMMLSYLDQTSSVGPNAPGNRRGRGLNENLARELLELHSLGVDGGYAQRDVRELAELLTGMTATIKDGFVYRPQLAEPGGETVLGQSYGGNGFDDIRSFLSDLSRKPETAAHIARKLAVHFTSDRPDDDLVRAMTRAYHDSDGSLPALYEVMLAHPASWESFGEKVKQPIDFVLSSMRALKFPARSLMQMKPGDQRALLTVPMQAMGQNWLAPDGPDGWAEDATSWITPQGLAARLQWAMSAPSVMLRTLPDPREFLDDALGDLTDPRMRFAAQNAENRREGIGLILASPAFQRR